MRTRYQKSFASKRIQHAIVVILIIAAAWLLGQAAVPSIMKAVLLGGV